MRISDWSSDVCSSDLQIQPKLETFHPAFFRLRQLGMHQAATCRHPLHAAILQQAFVAAAVTMTHTAIYHVGNGLKAAMGMIMKASDIVLGIICTEIVQHQEGIQPTLQIARQYTSQLDACTVRCGMPLHNALDLARLFDGFSAKGRNGSSHAKLLKLDD